VLEKTQEREEIIQRIAALDIGKANLVCCVRIPDPVRPGRRVQEVETYSTMTRSLMRMADRLRSLGVTRVVMEATSDYWKPAFYLLEAAGFETWLVNARDVKHLPGRPKTDRLDAVWLCKVAERQMLRPSFVPPPPIRMLRDLTRYRVDLVVAVTAEKNRAEKLLEDAQIKLSVGRTARVPAKAAWMHQCSVVHRALHLVTVCDGHDTINNQRVDNPKSKSADLQPNACASAAPHQ